MHLDPRPASRSPGNLGQRAPSLAPFPTFVRNAVAAALASLGLRYREVARAMGCTEGQVCSYIFAYRHPFYDYSRGHRWQRRR